MAVALGYSPRMKDIGFVGPDGVSRQRNAFEQQMRTMLHENTIFEGARLAFVSVADDVLFRAGRRARELPLQAGGESRATPPD